MPPQLNQELDEFVDTHVNNFIKWDLVVFFHQHPDTCDTPAFIATHLGRRPDDVTRAMEDLVDSKILSKAPSDSGDDVYAFAPDGQQATLVGEFIDALDSRERRLQILTKLLRLGARG